MNNFPLACLLAVVFAFGPVTGCSKKEMPDCIGTPGCEGEWKVFAGHLEEGQACTTPSGDLHVRYEKRTSDELVAIWSKLIPAKMGLETKKPWGASREYREGVYKKADKDEYLIVQIVQTASTKIRTVRLTWEKN
jgi:hypothetical protein